MKIYNTLTSKLEEFRPIIPNEVSMYVCGPTIYNYAHIGNIRPVVFFDTVYRYFKFLGYKVNYASNFTDVDDKIIKAANELKISEKELTKKFIDIYLNDLNNLNCLNIGYRPKVTENMECIIDFIKLLLDKGYAYKNNGNVYFRVNKVCDYGKLSNQDIDSLVVGSRIEEDENKENPLDFVLWKKTTEGIKWASPFGEGRPGWHTECVVMIRNLFKGKIDIHGGGTDLKFPHHENEMAQSQAIDNHELANYWMHNGLINIDGIKMSKSLGNFILAKDLIEKYGSNIVRLLILKSHYRLPLNITEELFNECRVIDEKIYNCLKQANIYLDSEDNNYKIDMKDFKKYMDNDFNTPNVISLLLENIKYLNFAIRNQKEKIMPIYLKINKILWVLGLEYKLVEFTLEDRELYTKWKEARINKEYDKADEYRKRLDERGIL